MNERAFIPISALMGALLLAVIAAMNPFAAGPDLAYAQSTETTLYELSIDGQTADPVTVSAFMPAFVPDGAPAEDGYTAYANTDENEIVVTATKTHTGAGVEVKAGATETAAKASTALTAGGTDSNEYTVTTEAAGEDTVILVTVAAADDVATATYMVTVMRGAADSDVTTLSALGLMAGGDEVEIDPNNDPFDGSVPAYTARVPNSTTRVDVMATPTDARDGATYAVTSDEDDNVQNNQVDLSAGDNVITVTVTAADKVTTGTYTVTVTRVASTVSTDTTLTALSLSFDDNGTATNIPLSPRFVSGRAPASSGYTARPAHGVGPVTLTATKSHVNATVEVKAGADEEAAEAAGAIAAAGTDNNEYSVTLQAEGTDTVVLVTVTAEDNASKATYKVTAERAADPASTVATLSALSVMAGGDELDIGTFASDTPAYTASVPYATSSVTVMATPTNRGASYEVESDEDNNVQNNRVDLSAGANVITVTVTAANGTSTQDYTVTVERASGTAARVTTLATLSLADDANAVSLMPEFDPDSAPASGGYMAYVANTVTTVAVTATASHTGADVEVRSGADEEEAMEATPAASVTLEDAGDSTVILVTVTAADGFAKATYKVTVMRGATGTDVITLSALSLMDAGGNDVGIEPEFDSGEVAYTARVPYDTMMVEVAATPTDARDGATYKVTSDEDSSVQNNQVDLSVGANVITITVTGADKVTTGAAGIYMVTVTRVADNLSTDTTLSVLMVNDGTDDLELDPEFVANSTPVEGGYAAEIGATIATVTVTATTAHTGASVEVRAGAAYDSAMEADAIDPETDGTYEVAEADGLQGQGADTVILVTVTAADLATTGTHMVTVSRDAADTNNELKSLMLNGDAVTLADSPTDNVHARVIVDVPSVTVMATPRNSMAEVTVTSNKDDDVEDNVVDLAVGINVITITVDPVSGDNNPYTIRIRRDLSDDASLSSLRLKHLPMNMMTGESIDLTPAFESGVMTYSADAGDAEEITVTAMAHPAATVSVTVNGTDAMKTDVATYWDMLGCPAMNDAVGADDQPDDATSPYCTTYHPDATHPGLMGDAKALVDETFANYYDVPLTMGDNTIAVMVTAEDGQANETYTVTVSVEATSDEARLRAIYDTDGNGTIEAVELRAAIQAYLAGGLPPSDMRILILLYLG